MGTDKASTHLGFWLSLPAFVVLILLALIPAVFAIGSANEGKWFPVVVPLIDDNGTPDISADDFPLPIVAAEYPSELDEAPYVDVFVQFDKIRNCDFLIEERIIDGVPTRFNRSLTWYSQDGRRLYIEFEPEDVNLPPTRPQGEQVAGPWRISGVRSLESTTAVVAHQCHPLWLTYSQFHP